MNGGHQSSLITSFKLIDALELDASLSEQYKAQLTLNHSDIPQERQQAESTLARIATEMRFRTLAEEELRVISDWYHSAIFESLPDHDDDVSLLDKSLQESELARRFGLDLPRVSRALTRMSRLGLVKEQGGIFRRTQKNLTTTTDVTSESLREAHRQLIAKSLKALDEQSVEERSFNSFILKIDKSKMAAAKDKLYDFCREFDKEFGGGDECVYCFSTQFFSLERKERPL